MLIAFLFYVGQYEHMKAKLKFVYHNSNCPCVCISARVFLLDFVGLFTCQLNLSQTHEIFDCQECRKKFISANQLKRHMITHSGKVSSFSFVLDCLYQSTLFSGFEDL